LSSLELIELDGQPQGSAAMFVSLIDVCNALPQKFLKLWQIALDGSKQDLIPHIHGLQETAPKLVPSWRVNQYRL
jgi:hypothetical protein